MLALIAARFGRIETRRRAARFSGRAAGRPSPEELLEHAEHAGDVDPHGMHYLLGRAGWDTDGVRDYVTTNLGDTDAVLVVDETGDLKKAPARSGSNASTPAPLGGSRTLRSRST
ncbi:hypothetical protein ACIREE_37485 [Streptomyces sp. NPDC102467]|uniref:hypothetical protein n=1 Tax=Streptomyces sp. NPDC102467 TaxID=3366179 RepID=UPI0038054DB3